MRKQDRKNNKQTIISEDIPIDTGKTLGRLMKLFLQQKKKLILVVIVTIASSIAYASMPLIAGSAIDALVAAMAGFDGSGTVFSLAASVLTVPALLIIAASLAASLFSYAQQYIIASVGEDMTLSLRRDISAKINRLPLRFFDRNKTGDILSRVTNDLEKLSTVMQTGFVQFISSFFTILLSCVAMLILSPILFLVVLAATIVSAFATKFVAKLSQRYFAANLAAAAALNAKIEELYTGNTIIKVFNRQQHVIEEIDELNEVQFKANRRAQFADYAIYPSIRFLNQLGFIATALTGGFMAVSGRMSLGNIQAFLQYVNQIAEPVTQASYVITSLQSAIAGAERVFNFMDENEEKPDTAAKTLPADAGVSFRNVRFGYVPERVLIKDLSLDLRPNQMAAIVGPTGGGKTTLVNLLMRFYELNGGHISIGGVSIADMPRAELRRRIGMVLQDTWLFEGTIAENIAYGRRDATMEEIIAAARAASCDHFIRTLPDGYNTIISSESSTVSQGQIQLLTIARAMLTNPSIMILDEATSSVDTRTEAEIQKAMTRLMKGKTSFVIAHRLSTIQNADMILVVRDGDIVERGTHESLLKENGFYASLYFSQFETGTCEDTENVPGEARKTAG